MPKITELSVSFLSLVGQPAHGKGLTLKGVEGQRVTPFELTLKNDDLMRAYGIVYAPGQVDAHGDHTDADTIRKAQAEFMREGRLKNIDTEHSFTSEMAFVAESWLVRKGDHLFPGEPDGAWAVGIQIGDSDLWRKLKAGELTGISLAGLARSEPDPGEPPHPEYTEKGQEPGWVNRLIKALTGANTPPVEETDMTKDEVTALVGETLKSLLPAALKEAQKSAAPPEEGDGALKAAVAEALKAAGIEPKEPTAVEKAVADALKAAGIEPKEPADDAPQNKQKTKSVEELVEAAVTKALAKGADTADPDGGKIEESFA